MIAMIKQKQPILTISIVETTAYQQGGCMITIGKIPKKVQTFFKPTRNALSAHVYTHYCNLVMAICISHGSTIKRLVNLLASRLYAEWWFKKEPGILDQELYPVLMIAGLQRTGTTKLQRLISADPETRSLLICSPAPPL